MTAIACSLSATDYQARLRDAEDLARRALRTRLPIPGGATLAFDPLPGVAAKLDAFVAAESECCPFLTLALRSEPDSLVLDVTGPADAQPIIAELFT